MQTKYFLLSLLLCVMTSCARNAQTNQQDSSTSTQIESACETTSTEVVVDEPTDLTCVEIPRLLSDQAQQVIEHLAYTVSHNPVWNIPNWVAYTLTSEELQGDIPRAKKFYPDPDVEGVAVVTSDYTHSGYDRGHMAPAADMKWSEQAMHESFYMTNICPQNQSLNRGDWNDLEELTRDWAMKFGEVHIVCGPLMAEEYSTIGQNTKVAVPEAFFKVFLRQKGSEWTSIGFVMPNQAVNRPMMTYMLSVDEVEAMSGIDFFYNLPNAVEDSVEKDFSISDWTL